MIFYMACTQLWRSVIFDSGMSLEILIICCCCSFREESMREMALRLSLEEESKRKNDHLETHERSIIIIGSKGVVSSRNSSEVRRPDSALIVGQVVK